MSCDAKFDIQKAIKDAENENSSTGTERVEFPEPVIDYYYQNRQ